MNAINAMAQLSFAVREVRDEMTAGEYAKALKEVRSMESLRTYRDGVAGTLTEGLTAARETRSVGLGDLESIVEVARSGIASSSPVQGAVTWDELFKDAARVRKTFGDLLERIARAPGISTAMFPTNGGRAVETAVFADSDDDVGEPRRVLDVVRGRCVGTSTKAVACAVGLLGSDPLFSIEGIHDDYLQRGSITIWVADQSESHICQCDVVHETTHRARSHACHGEEEDDFDTAWDNFILADRILSCHDRRHKTTTLEEKDTSWPPRVSLAAEPRQSRPWAHTGAFAAILEATTTTTTTTTQEEVVLVKVPRRAVAGSSYREKLRRCPRLLLSSTTHANIAKFLGVAAGQPDTWSPDWVFGDRPCLVFQGAKNATTLDEVLRLDRMRRLRFGGPVAPLSVVLATTYARDIASGLTFLHDGDIIHGDVKPANVLVVGKTLKLTDGGVAADAFDDAAVYSPRWMPPERAIGDVTATTTSGDVFAFGMTLYSILQRQYPWPNLVRARGILSAIAQGNRPIFDGDIIALYPGLTDTARLAWTHLPDDRPDAPALVDDLQHLLDALIPTPDSTDAAPPKS